MESTLFASEVARTCISAYNNLPKTGKPNSSEWTVLAGVVMCDTRSEAANGAATMRQKHPSNPADRAYRLTAAALGTGSKCLGRHSYCPSGGLVHDSHAEVVARRSLQLFLLEQASAAYAGRDSVLELAGEPCSYAQSADEFGYRKLAVKGGISFHFYSSQTPCGDCSIFPKEFQGVDRNGSVCNNIGKKRYLEDETVRKCKFSKMHNCETVLTERETEMVEESSVNNTSFDEPNCVSRIKDPLQNPRNHISDLHYSMTNKSSSNCCKTERKECYADKNQSNINSSSTSQSCSAETKQQKGSSKGLDQSQSRLLPDDIHRTGAKCVTGEATDQRTAGASYHSVGPLRTKPGRGDPTASHCCSDKMFRWSVMGLQGALLMPFLAAPVYVASVVIGGAECCLDALQRGLFKRFDTKMLAFREANCSTRFYFREPNVYHCSDVRFGSSPDNVSLVRPSSASISWYRSENERKPDVFADGARLGVTKKMRGTARSRVGICRLEIMMKVLDLHRSNTSDVDNVSLDDMPYRRLKDLSVEYCNTLRLLRKKVLCNWTEKGLDLQMFRIS